MDLAKKPLSVQETWETRYEQLMEQFASDMRLYMGMVRAMGHACRHRAGSLDSTSQGQAHTQLGA